MFFHTGGGTMRVGISLTSSQADAEDPCQGARWMIERTATARHAGLDSLFVGDHYVSPTPTNDQRKVPGSLERLEEVCAMPG
jgi:alkanesulfonate monooxygenase SsuD/methylene tetrahydromethanopterin reductase-like flavin-dependent oxidoreductase (luciferase family)